MRGLEFDDLFNAVRVIDNSGLRDETANLISKVSAGTDLRRLGIVGILNTLGVFAKPDTSAAVYEFLSGPFEMPAEEIRHMSLSRLRDCFKQLSEDPGTKDFFGWLSDMITQS